MTADAKILLEQEDMSADALKMFSVSRLHPNLKTKRTLVIIYINLLIALLYLTLSIKGIAISYNEDLLFMSECIQTCIISIHFIVKTTIIHNNKTALSALIEKKSQFWRIMDFSDTPLYSQYLDLVTFFKKVIRFYLITALLAGVIFGLQPYTIGVLPSKCYVPPGWFYYISIMMSYMSVNFFFTVQATDCFFFSLACSLLIQLQLLAYKFKNLISSSSSTETEIWKRLKNLIDYHSYLLSYCKELNVVFESIFFLQFGISIASASVAIFNFMQPGNWINRLKFLFYFAALIIETGFYCVPLEFVMDAAQQLSDFVYETTWYNLNENQLKKSLSVIINRAQKPVIFSAYGMIDMNLRTYVLICKTIFTYYTYLTSAQKLAMK